MSASNQVGWSSSDPVTKSPFGNLPFALAGGAAGRFTRPLSTGFGFGGGRNYDQFQAQLAQAEGPLADFIRQGQSFLPSYIPGMQQVGQQVTQQGQQAFTGFQDSINQFMQQLPNFQALVGQGNQGAQQAQGYARQLTEQAFSPIQDQALYQQASRNALDASRQGTAARGLVDQGAAQASENDILTNLALDFAQRAQGNQSNAINSLLGASGQVAQGGQLGAQLAAMGPQAQQALFAAIPQLGQVLGAQYQMPFDAMQQVGGFLAAQQNPLLQLLQLTSPTVAQSSSSFQGGGSAGIS